MSHLPEPIEPTEPIHPIPPSMASEPPPLHQPGDLVNGHVMQTDGSWLPVQSNLRSNIEQEVDQRTKNSKLIAWMLWLFLAGCNAHLFYVWPRARVATALLTVLVFWPVMGVLTIFTAFLIWPLWWVLSAIPLLVPSTWNDYRDYVRRDVETDQLRRNQLYR